MARRFRYKVMGRGDFPWDMLRYDRVYPITNPSPSRYDDKEEWTKSRTVEVEGLGCTPDRWSSFLWSVVDKNEAAQLYGVLE